MAAFENGEPGNDEETGALDLAWQLNAGTEFGYYNFSKEVIARSHAALLESENPGNVFWATDKGYELADTSDSTVSLLENTAIILVPMAEAVLRHKLPKAATAVSALVAIGGVALLTGQSGGFTPGMVLAVMAAVLYAAAIITTDRFSHEDDPLTLGIVQVGTLGLLALVSSFVFEAPHLPQSGTQWLMIAGLAVICTGFGFTLQPVAQSHTTAQRAGLFCALSPACATLLGAAVLREHISVMGMCGIALILLSLLVPQLWQLAEKKGITLPPRHAVPAVRRA